MHTVLALIPLLPLLGFVFIGLFGRKVGQARPSPSWPWAWWLCPSLLSVVAFAEPGRRAASRVDYGEWMAVGDLQVPFGLVFDPLSRPDGPGGHRHRRPDPPLFRGLHGPGRGLCALLRLPEPLRVLHADPGAGLLPAPAVRGLGGRGPLQLPAHRLLLRDRRTLRRPASRPSSPTAWATWAWPSA